MTDTTDKIDQILEDNLPESPYGGNPGCNRCEGDAANAWWRERYLTLERRLVCARVKAYWWESRYIAAMQRFRETIGNMQAAYDHLRVKTNDLNT